ncbi:MAG: glycosyltransferase [Candidatus Methanoperedens sp.]|nr:glycosyltransferase [Candidatus Methanoperedens sp.]
MKKDKTKVSIGMPVYNGEKYLTEALDSILAQTFVNFELILSDNASTDRTSDICLEYANKDSRIRYFRNEKNLGGAWNFNRVFELSDGKYFKWAAHDDIISSDFLLKCVEVLDNDPSVILCYSDTIIIDENGKIIENYDLNLNTDSPKIHERFRDILLKQERCFEQFGLIRASALIKTSLMGNYGHADGILLAKLVLLGRFYKIPEYLFFERKHPQQSMNLIGCDRNNMPNYYLQAIWFDPAKTGKIILPYWKMLSEYCIAVLQVPLNFYDRIFCFPFLIKWAMKRRYYLMYEIIIAAKQAFSLKI